MTRMLEKITALAKRLYRNPNPAEEPEDAHTSSQDDALEASPDSKDDALLQPRFEYDPKYFVQRLLVSIGGKTKLASSKLIKIPYRWWLRWVLVGLLFFITVFLTPQMLPKWLGFKWSNTNDLCEDRTEKIALLSSKIQGLAGVQEGARFVQHSDAALECMRAGAHKTWSGLDRRVLYPGECIPANARAKTGTTTVCVGGQRVEKCVKLFGIVKLKCASQTSPRKCENITASDASSIRRIADINALRRVQQSATLDNDTKEKAGEIAETADKAGERLVNRLLTQIDIASNLYIFYTMVAVIVGTPVIIYKRERSARVLGAALGLRKSNFIILVVVILTIYDSGAKVLREANFPQLFRNFQNDACYLDPKFSKARLELIGTTCANITEQRTSLNDKSASMTSVYYDTQLCEVCAVGDRGPTENPVLVRNINLERSRFSNGTENGYVYPGSCNATQLNEETSVPPEKNIGIVRAFLGSGILAQILLKGILSSWVTHLISMQEPMTMHRGMVEIFGMTEGQATELTEAEMMSVLRFARDKHLMPLIIASMMMVWEIVIISYSFVESARNTGNLLRDVAVAPNRLLNRTHTCIEGQLLRK